MKQVSLVSIVSARSGTGKTTFMEKLIKELVQRGYKIGAIKSDAHGFDIDVPGKDSWRFTQAGATVTAVVGPKKFALIEETETKKDLDEVAGMIRGVDLILVEGYKMAQKPRIEIVRSEKGRKSFPRRNIWWRWLPTSRIWLPLHLFFPLKITHK